MAVLQGRICKVFSRFWSGDQRRLFLEIRHSLFYTCRWIHMTYLYRRDLTGSLWSSFPITLFPMSNTSNCDFTEAKLWFALVWFIFFLWGVLHFHSRNANEQKIKKFQGRKCSGVHKSTHYAHRRYSDSCFFHFTPVLVVAKIKRSV